MTTLEEIRATASGGRIIAEWLGENGEPVLRSLAEARSLICEYCPENCEPSWWDRVKSTIADAIKAMLEARHKMGITVSNESSINMCRVCGCCARLLVHTPIEHIGKHMTAEQYFKHPPACWKRKELSELTHLNHLHD